MPKKQLYENALIYTLVFIFFASIGLGIWLLKSLPLLPTIVLIISTPLSFLIIKNNDLFKGEIKSDSIVMGIFLVSVACSVTIVAGNNKTEAYLDKLLLDGSVQNKEVFVEGDGESVDHYETKYYFNSRKEPNDAAIEIIGWLLVAIYIIAPCVNYKLVTTAQKQNNSHISQKKSKTSRYS